jgi:hypothetical protein
MTATKTFSYIFRTTICLFLLIAGCAPSGEQAAKPEVETKEQIEEVIVEGALSAIAEEAAEPEVELEEQIPQAPPAAPVVLALKFTPQDSTTYRVTTEEQQTVKWTGVVPDDPNFESGLKINRLEMTFTQQVQGVEDNGNAIVKITIERLKHHFETIDKPAIEFDSSDTKGPKHPLAGLIGQSYSIEIAPTGEVTKILDVKQVQDTLKKHTADSGAAFQLLTPDKIKERHGTLLLPNPDKNQIQTGDDWTNTKTFHFGSAEPGSYEKFRTQSSYEKIYTLKEIKNIDNRQVAIIEMNAIPAPETAEQSFEEQAGFDFSEMFDSTSKYTGRLRFDLSAGKIEKYHEKLESEWTTVVPPGIRKAEEPVVLMLGAVRLYNLEKID